MKKMYKQIRILLFLAVAVAGATKADAQCPPVTSITRTILRCDSVEISWPRVTGATDYLYAVTLSSRAPSAGQAAPTTSIKIGDLLPSTKYYVYVKTNCTMNVSGWVADSFQTPACAPGTCLTPNLITFDSVNMNRAKISWTPVAGAAGYEYVLNNTFADPTTGGTVVTTPNVTVSGLTPGTNYFFHLRTQCGPGNISAWKMGRIFGTEFCTVPGKITSAIHKCDSVTISWPLLSGPVDYIYAVTPTATAPTTGLTSTTGIVNMGGLLPSTLYYVYVRSNCGTFKSDWKKDTLRTPACSAGACTVPSTVTYNSITATTANISWTAATGATGYEYVLNQLAADPAGAGTATTATNAAFTGLTGGTTYYWHLRTKCGSGYSAWKPGATLVTTKSTGVTQTAGHSVELSVYPNPASGEVTVEMSQQPGKDARITVFSIDGKTVRSIVPALKTAIDIHDLQRGIYFIRYTDSDQKKVIRFTKE